MSDKECVWCENEKTPLRCSECGCVVCDNCAHDKESGDYLCPDCED